MTLHWNIALRFICIYKKNKKTHSIMQEFVKNNVPFNDETTESPLTFRYSEMHEPSRKWSSIKIYTACFEIISFTMTVDDPTNLYYPMGETGRAQEISNSLILCFLRHLTRFWPDDLIHSSTTQTRRSQRHKMNLRDYFLFRHFQHTCSVRRGETDKNNNISVSDQVCRVWRKS